MTSKNNRELLLYYVKLCASFQIHWWIQTGFAVQKRSIRVEIGKMFSRETLKFDGWPWKTIGHLFYATSSFVQHFVAIGPPKVLLLRRSWGACVPRRSHRLCQLEFWLLVGTTMLDRLWFRGQTKCNTPLMLATSVFGRIHRRRCYVMAQPKSRLDIPWPNDAECMGHVWYNFSCWYPLLFDVESQPGV